jgi:hypothetical protein
MNTIQPQKGGKAVNCDTINDLEDLRLREKRQGQKEKYHMVSNLRGT